MTVCKGGYREVKSRIKAFSHLIPVLLADRSCIYVYLIPIPNCQDFTNVSFTHTIKDDEFLGKESVFQSDKLS